MAARSVLYSALLLSGTLYAEGKTFPATTNCGGGRCVGDILGGFGRGSIGGNGFGGGGIEGSGFGGGGIGGSGFGSGGIGSGGFGSGGFGSGGFGSGGFGGSGFGGGGIGGSGFGGGGIGGSGFGDGRYQCGRVQCITQIKCDKCDYPQPFVQQVSFSRSVLSRLEEFIQSVGQYGINAMGRLGNTAVSIPAGFMEMSIRNGMTLVNDINSAIESLTSFINHQVVGRIAYDIISDLSDSLSIIRKLVGWCGSYNSGGSVIPMPQQIISRYQQPMNWNNQCSGAWPCTTIVPYVTAKGAQSNLKNKYSYAKQHNRGNTQILNSSYDSGSDLGYGNSEAAAQNFNFEKGGFPFGMRSSRPTRSKSSKRKYHPHE